MRLVWAKMAKVCRDFVVCTVSYVSHSISVTFVSSPHDYSSRLAHGYGKLDPITKFHLSLLSTPVGCLFILLNHRSPSELYYDTLSRRGTPRLTRFSFTTSLKVWGDGGRSCLVPWTQKVPSAYRSELIKQPLFSACSGSEHNFTRLVYCLEVHLSNILSPRFIQPYLSLSPPPHRLPSLTSVVGCCCCGQRNKVRSLMRILSNHSFLFKACNRSDYSFAYFKYCGEFCFSNISF